MTFLNLQISNWGCDMIIKILIKISLKVLPKSSCQMLSIVIDSINKILGKVPCIETLLRCHKIFTSVIKIKIVSSFEFQQRSYTLILRGENN